MPSFTISNVTGTWITDEQATDPRYWAQHLLQTVRFGAGLGELLSEPSRVLLEIGPGRLFDVVVSNTIIGDAKPLRQRNEMP